MNAKKIMGAVLVALLAAALFIGAGAAATAVTGAGETVFVYQPVTGVSGTWANGANTVTFEAVTDGVAIKGTDIVEGTYKQGSKSLIVKYPTAVISAVGGTYPNEYDVIGGVLYKGDNVVVTNVTGAGINAAGYLLTLDGVEYIKTTDELQKYLKNHTGSYKVQVYFNADQFVNGTPANYLNGAAYTIKVVEADDAEVTASVDTVKPNGKVLLTITAKPGSKFNLTDETEFTIVSGQQNVENDATIVVPNTGKVTVAVQADSGVDGKQTIELDNLAAGAKNIKVSVTVEKGSITANADAASYFVGNVITISGKNTAGTINGLALKGTNFNYALNLSTDVTFKDETSVSSEDFKFTIDTADLLDDGKKLDVGTYTLTINASGPTATVAVALKQPFISIVEAPEVIVKNTDDNKFIINAEAADKIAYYIFGTNFFAYKNVTTPATDEDGEDIENQFLVELDKDVTGLMAAGQYFVVFQHPMYDGEYQIVSGYNVSNHTENWTIVGANGATVTPIDVKTRQTANAAQALCDALDAQTIDDMYVKYSFFVVGEGQSFEISDLPTSVVKGDKIVITGVDTANKGGYVTAEMISTAFAAVPKETVGSAAFIVVTAQINEDDGTFELTLDTSDLNVDEYSLSVAINSVTQKTTTVNVVEGADEPVTPEQPEQPEQPENPEEPVAPATPGFGALAALAGLGAVAVLLLRRE